MELSINDIRALLFAPAPTPEQNGDTWGAYPPSGTKVFIRTVTMTYTGAIADVTKSEVVLDQCAWIADSGRFADALRTGTLNEIEPFPDGPVIIGRGGIIDVSRWNHALPRLQK